MRLDLAIAHTRWATHGKPSKENAHPHFDETESIAVVHNGIIENHFALREMLQAKGKKFYSDTDTEVIAQLVSYFYEGEILPAIQKALALLRGFWGIALIHKDHPNQIIAAARENPIAIGFNADRIRSLRLLRRQRFFGAKPRCDVSSQRRDRSHQLRQNRSF